MSGRDERPICIEIKRCKQCDELIERAVDAFYALMNNDGEIIGYLNSNYSIKGGEYEHILDVHLIYKEYTMQDFISDIDKITCANCGYVWTKGNEGWDLFMRQIKFHIRMGNWWFDTKQTVRIARGKPRT